MPAYTVTEETLKWLPTVKKGAIVTRVIGAAVRMELIVSEVKDGLIHCGPWTFSLETGGEIDESLGWTELSTGSFIEETKRKG